MNIAELALKSLEVGEHVSYIFEGREITNVEMDRAARKFGSALLKLGVSRGDRVIMQMQNCPEVFQAFQAIWRIGAVALPINYLVGQEEINFIYQDSGVHTVITTPEYLDKVRTAQAKSGAVKNIIVVSDKDIEGTQNFAKLLTRGSEDLAMVGTQDDEVATMIYTSGTTGTPKGVMLTHAGLAYSARMQQEATNLPQDLVSMAILPLCHSFGVSMMNGSFLRLKGKVVILRQFNLEQVFASIDRYKVQSVPIVPTMIVYMLMFPDWAKYDLSSVKYWVCGSAPLSLDTWKQFKEKFGAEIAEGWGLTEAGANNATNVGQFLIKPGSIGKPMKGMEMKIFDGSDREVPQGQEGEIVLRGPMVMKGYWKMPEATAEVIVNGWLHTGDIGYVDQDGYFYITDRKKDIIIKGGENISPRVIEEVLYAHEAVSEASVIGIKDKVYGEEIKAFVTLKAGTTATADEILEYCRGKLKKFFVPKEVVILAAMPKTLVGKILKKELRKI
ncbi:MAG: long-chain fatty acid--CoA ligase [Deltaproteobacteria bacterium]|nr:long-chain fatty acid--CoA ligase [Deltaproteobacteria bacterium]